MDKLTLEILSAYLPWGIEVEFTYYGKQPKIYRLDHLIITEWLTSKGSVKPLLRPLSNFKDINSPEVNYMNLDLMDHIAIHDFASSYVTLESLDYGVVRELLRNHVDVFGLIDKGFAVAIEREVESE